MLNFVILCKIISSFVAFNSTVCKGIH